VQGLWKNSQKVSRGLRREVLYKRALINFERDEYRSNLSKSLEEDQELIKEGFKPVTERDEVSILENANEGYFRCA